VNKIAAEDAECGGRGGRRGDELTTNPDLLSELRRLGQLYGPLGVAMVAITLTDMGVVRILMDRTDQKLWAKTVEKRRWRWRR
jgi:hypothetical protein